MEIRFSESLDILNVVNIEFMFYYVHLLISEWEFISNCCTPSSV